jgi:hypothetical protein
MCSAMDLKWAVAHLADWQKVFSDNWLNSFCIFMRSIDAMKKAGDAILERYKEIERF